MTEAIFRTKQGEKVLLIDEQNDLCGAWKTIKYNRLPEIEVGCHIWDIQKDTFRFLESFYGLNLSSLSPQPVLLSRGKRIPYDWKMNLLTTRLVLSRLSRFKLKTLSKELKSPANRFSILPGKYLYPVGGAKEFSEKLKQKFSQYNIDYRLEVMMDHLEIDKSNVRIKLSNGDEIQSDHLVMTSLTKLKSVKLPERETLYPETRDVRYIHTHIILDRKPSKAFSYIRWMDDDMIHRVSDMTSQVSDKLDSNQSLICLAIHEEAFDKDSMDNIVKRGVQKLKEAGYLDNDSKAIDYEHNVYPSYYNDANNLWLIKEQSEGRVSVLHSTNFTYSFFNQVARYEALLSTSAH